MTTRSTTPPLSELSDLAARLDEPQALEPTVVRALPPPPVPPLSDFELELRRRLSQIESHQARTDSVVLEFQGDVRRQFKEVEARIAAKLDGVLAAVGQLVEQVKKLVGNGHD